MVPKVIVVLARRLRHLPKVINRQLIVLISRSKQQVDDFVGELTL